MDGSTEGSKGSWVTCVEPRVAVIGIGGAGCNIINDIYWAGDSGIETIAINTDRQALSEIGAHHSINICRRVTRGEGAKGDPDLGRSCGKAHADEIEDALKGFDVVFIIAGMGGGTGTGVAPVVVDVCHRLGQIAFAVLINPFSFETSRSRVAKEGLRRMRQSGCMNVVIDNDMLLKNLSDSTIDKAFRAANQSILQFIKGTSQKVRQSFIDQLDDLDGMIQEVGDEKVSGLCAFEPVRIN